MDKKRTDLDANPKSSEFVRVKSEFVRVFVRICPNLSEICPNPSKSVHVKSKSVRVKSKIVRVKSVRSLPLQAYKVGFRKICNYSAPNLASDDTYLRDDCLADRLEPE